MLGRATNLRRLAATLLTATDFANPAARLTKPSANAFIDLSADVKAGPTEMFVVPYGTGADNGIFALRFVGWTKVGEGDNTPTLQDFYLPTPVLEISCTMGATVGPTNGILPATNRFCDAITIVKEPVITSDVTPMGTVELYSPGSDLVAWLRAKLPGVNLLSLDCDLGGGSPTAAGCLIGLR